MNEPTVTSAFRHVHPLFASDRDVTWHHRVMISVRTDATVDVVALRLLGDPVRARIVEHLAVEQLCTCHLVELVGATQSNVSNHLRALRQAGLVLAEPHGRFTYYRLVPSALARLGGQLDALSRGAEAALDRRRPCP